MTAIRQPLKRNCGACSGRCCSVVMMPLNGRMLSPAGKLLDLSFAV